MTSSAAQQKPIKRHIVSVDEEAMRHDAEAETTEAPELHAKVFNSLEAAEGPWRALEATALLTPYQRYDWIKALVDTRGLEGRCAVAVIASGGRPVALFPFAISRKFGVRTAGIIGADIGNAGWLVMERETAPRLTPEVLERLFVDIGRQAGGLDMVSLLHQPESWGGIVNPLLAFPHQPAPDHLYMGPLGPAGVPHLSGKRIRNIERGRRRLQEEMGPVVLRRADSVEEIARVHAVFLEQRNVRFAEMGIRNVFADDWFVAFFKRAAAGSPGSDQPAIRFHALHAGDEIVAISCGACTGTHYSQFINSTASGPAARYSLMGILMYDLVAELAGTGVTSIDMGRGDFDYKTDWTERRVLFDSAIPVTPAGRIAAPALLWLRRLKRAIKQNQRLFGVLKRLRAMTLRHRNHPPHSPSEPDKAE